MQIMLTISVIVRARPRSRRIGSIHVGRTLLCIFDLKSSSRGGAHSPRINESRLRYRSTLDSTLFALALRY